MSVEKDLIRLYIGVGIAFFILFVGIILGDWKSRIITDELRVEVDRIGMQLEKQSVQTHIIIKSNSEFWCEYTYNLFKDIHACSYSIHYNLTDNFCWVQKECPTWVYK